MSTLDPDAPARALQRLFAGETLSDLAEVPSEHLETLYAKAFHDVARGNFDEALDALQYLVVHDPYDCRFQFGYGLCLHQLGQAADAAKHYGLAYMLDPSDAGTAFRLGECHLAMGDRDAAIEAFQTAIQLCQRPQAASDIRQLAEAALDRLNA